MRTFTHIGNEVGEAVPAFANFYTTTTVVFVALIVWIIASIAQALPYAIKRMFSKFFTASMTGRSVRTLARVDFARSKINAGGGMFAATVALAKPSHMIVDSVGVDAPDRDQSTEPLTCDIFEFGHIDLHDRLMRQVAKLVQPALASLRILAEN